ncbi:hypothetical protein [Exiguobacterium sp.]|uniref:hypothetical protein n=1 Tax=Exiguobacterium sp. TaxID=44751 RepID=UPI002896D82E|nr:hypothetical protein [Exiguobacterium sp.]
MGFWSTVASGAVKVGKAMLEEAEKSKEIRDKQLASAERRASGVNHDRDLVNCFQNSSGIDKRAYALELEKRGYLERDHEGKLKRTSKKL